MRGWRKIFAYGQDLPSDVRHLRCFDGILPTSVGFDGVFNCIGSIRIWNSRDVFRENCDYINSRCRRQHFSLFLW